jgi:hypothetical protein
MKRHRSSFIKLNDFHRCLFPTVTGTGTETVSDNFLAFSFC